MARVPASAKRVIASFLATDAEVVQDPLGVSAPEANAYEFQSGGVVDMLQNLKDKFEDEVRELEKDEMQAQHAYELMSQELTENIKQADAEMSGKAKTKAEREEAAAQATGDLADTTSAHAEDTKDASSSAPRSSRRSRRPWRSSRPASWRTRRPTAPTASASRRSTPSRSAAATPPCPRSRRTSPPSSRLAPRSSAAGS